MSKLYPNKAASSTLQPGDRAMILHHVDQPQLVGTIVTVVGALKKWEWIDYEAFGSFQGHELECEPHPNGAPWCHPAKWLMKIPPPDEARRMFRETSSPRRKKHSA